MFFFYYKNTKKLSILHDVVKKANFLCNIIIVYNICKIQACDKKRYFCRLAGCHSVTIAQSCNFELKFHLSLTLLILQKHVLAMKVLS